MISIFTPQINWCILCLRDVTLSTWCNSYKYRVASGITFKAKLKLLYLLNSSEPSFAFQYTLSLACASVLRQLFLKSAFNTLLISWNLIGWLSELTTRSESQTNIVENKNIKNMIEGTKVQIRDKQCCFPPCWIICFPFQSSTRCALAPLYIMLISTVQIDCYDEFLKAFICLW